MLGNLGLLQGFQMELHAARQNRYRQFMRIGSRQQEFHIFRRLFQGF